MVIKRYVTRLNEEKHNVLVVDKEVEVRDRDMQVPSQIVAMLNEGFDMQHFAEEHIYMLAYTAAGNVTAVFEVTHGIVRSSLASAREIFIRALLAGAAYIVLVHNHPSGNPTPGEVDHTTTQFIFNAGCIMNVPLADHIIIGENGSYYSFAENKKMPTQIVI